VAYLDLAANEAAWMAGRATIGAREIRLGAAERQTILRARRDARAGRTGASTADPRLDALRAYALLPNRRAVGAGRLLIAAGFSPAERRVVDAMIEALPARAASARSSRGRLVTALLILAPLLIAVSAFGWARASLGDPLIAVVVSGLALLLMLPLAGAVAAPVQGPPRR
jgi:hypothetical protein